MTDHPITPPPDELVDQWRNDNLVPENLANYVATQAARWASDQELEACCEWVAQFNYDDYRYQDELRAARRPKPPSLKEQALAVLDDVSDRLDAAHENVLRRALERLQALEGNG